MLVTEVKIRENYSLSTEDFVKLYNRKPEILTLKIKSKERDYHEYYSQGMEAFFGENNIYKSNTVLFMKTLRKFCNIIKDKKASASDKKTASNSIKALIDNYCKFIEKCFNIHKCYLGLIDDMNAFCYPLCWDAQLVDTSQKTGKGNTKKLVNEKFRVDLEDIAETKNGYKYKKPDNKIYCVGFGIQFFNTKGGKDIYTDEECAAILTHEFGHAMQQACCSITENLASAYIHEAFNTVHSFLNPFILTYTFGLSSIGAIIYHQQLKQLKREDKDKLGREIIVDGLGSNLKIYDRNRIGKDLDQGTKDTIKGMEKGKGKFANFLFKTFMFTIMGFVRFTDHVLLNIHLIPQYLYTLSQNSWLKKNRRFEQFADIYTAAYGLGPYQASALAKLGNNFGFKQDYGMFSFLNYVPGLNIITGVANYMENGMNQFVAGYPDTTGRMAAIYKSLSNDLNNNKDLSAEDKKAIQKQIDMMNQTYDDYVYDWSPKGFTYALWSKIRFKTLKNTKSDAQTNVLDALKELNTEEKFKHPEKFSKLQPDNTTYDIPDFDNDRPKRNKFMSSILNSIKDIKMKFGSIGQKITSPVEKMISELKL